MAERLGRLTPPDFEHVKNHLLRTLGSVPVFNIEKNLVLPSWHTKHDQGAEGACVGHGTGMMMAIRNTHQCLKQGARNPYIRYNSFEIWERAKEVDGFDESNRGDDSGTTVRAACEILRLQGAPVWENEDDVKSFIPPEIESGIEAYRWATTVDELRQCINENQPITMGTNWYTNFDTPEYTDGEWYIGKQLTSFGTLRGGHSYCIFGASDQRQAFRVKNSWGLRYPEVWLPYSATQRLLDEEGEACIITDR